MRNRREIMRRRRMVTYTVAVLLLLSVVIGLNELLLKSQLESLHATPEMVWYNGYYIEASAAEALKGTPEQPVVHEELPYAPVVRTPEKDSSRRVAPITVTEEEYEILLKIGMAEAAGEPIEGVRAVYTVIFNRMAKNHLGESTVKGTIFKPYQFSGVGVGQWNTPPSDKVRQALDDVLNGYRSFEEEILFYHYPEVATDKTQVNRVTVRYKIGVHEFGVIKP